MRRFDVAQEAVLDLRRRMLWTSHMPRSQALSLMVPIEPGLLDFAPASKRLGLSFPSLRLASLKARTDALHACLVEGWASCFVFRRPLMSIMDRIRFFADMSQVDQTSPKITRLELTRPVAQKFCPP